MSLFMSLLRFLMIGSDYYLFDFYKLIRNSKETACSQSAWKMWYLVVSFVNPTLSNTKLL